MKVFNLEAAKRGEPIQTRDGDAVKFVAHVPEADQSNQIIVVIGDTIVSYYENGLHAGVFETEIDLFMAPRKRTVWVNFYRGEFGLNSSVSDTQEKAERSHKVVGKQRIGGRAWPVEIEE